MFITWGENGSGTADEPSIEIVSLREGSQIPDCLTDLSDPTSFWSGSAGGDDDKAPRAGKRQAESGQAICVASVH